MAQSRPADAQTDRTATTAGAIYPEPGWGRVFAPFTGERERERVREGAVILKVTLSVRQRLCSCQEL